MKIISIVLIALLSINLVIAGTELVSNNKIILEKAKIDFLKTKNITSLSITEYECDVDNRCFKLDGHMNGTLITIPQKVFNGYKKIKTTEIKPILINGKQIPRKVTVYKTTTEKQYRDITDKEILQIIDNSLNVKIEKMMKTEDTSKNTIKYNPITVLEK